MNKKKLWIPISLIVIFLLGAGFALYEPIKHYFFMPHKIEHENKRIMKQSPKDIKANVKNHQSSNKNTNSNGLKYTYDSSNVQSIGDTKDVGQVDPRYMNGVIIVPSVNIKLPILEGVSNTNLNYGAGTMKPNQEMGKNNYALAGHHAYSEGALFTPLMHLPKNAKIYLTDKSKVYEYTTTKQFTVDKSQGQVIDDVKGKKMVTLVTCTDVEGTKRLIIQGNLTHTYKANQAPQSVAQQINN